MYTYIHYGDSHCVRSCGPDCGLLGHCGAGKGIVLFENGELVWVMFFDVIVVLVGTVTLYMIVV